MKNEIQLVGRMGVVRVPLVGGPYDGETRVAVVGCPVLVPVKPPKAKKADLGLMGGYISFFGSGPIEGEEWRGEKPAPRPEQRASRFALYAPRQTDEGKATLALFFVDEVTA